jgi:hypothetical protein
MKRIIAPVLVAGLMGSAQAKPIQKEICPTKVSGKIEKCKDGKKCVLHLKKGDVLSNIEYFGSTKCRKRTGFTIVGVTKVDSKGVAFNVKGIALPGMKKHFRADFRTISKRMKALGIRVDKTKDPKVARLILNK